MNRIREKASIEFLVSKTLEDPSKIYKAIGDSLTDEERKYIKKLLKTDCYNCTNKNCNVETNQKPIVDCNDWENNAIIGKYKVLKSNIK